MKLIDNLKIYITYNLLSIINYFFLFSKDFYQKLLKLIIINILIKKKLMHLTHTDI